MNPYLLERLVAERHADILREVATAKGQAHRSKALMALAGALRGIADRLDGRAEATRLGTIRALD